MIAVLVLAVAGLAPASISSRWSIPVGGVSTQFDPAGKVWSTADGSTYMLTEPDANDGQWRDVRLSKFNLTGVKQWEYRLPGLGAFDDHAGQVKGLGSDVVFTAIRAKNSKDRECLAVRVTPTGTVAWTANLGPANETQALLVTVNNTILVGLDVPGPLGFDLAGLASLSPLGTMSWREVYSASLVDGHDVTRIVESQNNVLIGGNAGSWPFIVAFSKAGEELWHDAVVDTEGTVIGMQVMGQNLLVQVGDPGSDASQNGLLKYSLLGGWLYENYLKFENEVYFAASAKVGELAYVLTAQAGTPESWGLRRYRATSSYPAILGPFAGPTDREPESILGDASGLLVGGVTFVNGGWRPIATRIDLDTMSEQWAFTGTSSARRHVLHQAPNGDVLMTSVTTSGDLLVQRLQQKVAIQSLVLSHTSGNSGVKPKLAVTLVGKAPGGGIAVALSSNKAVFGVPTTVLVPAGQTTVDVFPTVSPVAANTVATITGSSDGVSKTVQYTVLPPKLVTLTSTPVDIYGGEAHSLELALDSKAPSNFVATLTAPVALGLPATATFSPNALKKVVSGVASPTATTKDYVVKATRSGVTVSTPVKVRGPILAALKVTGYAGNFPAPLLYDSSKPLPVKAEIRGKSPTSTVVKVTDTLANLTASNISIPAGALAASKSFPVTVSPAATVEGKITGQIGSATPRSVLLCGQRGVLKTFVAPATVSGGQAWVLSITLENAAPAGGVLVKIETQGFSPSALGIGVSGVVVGAGAKSATKAFIVPGGSNHYSGKLILSVSKFNGFFREIKIN